MATNDQCCSVRPHMSAAVPRVALRTVGLAILLPLVATVAACSQGSAGKTGGATGGGGVGGTATGGTGGTAQGGRVVDASADKDVDASGGGRADGGAGRAGGAAGAAGGTAGISGRDAAVDVEVQRDAADGGRLVDAAVDLNVPDAQSLPGTNNPVLPGLFADPSIVAFDDTFYIYPTTDGVADWGATSFSVFSSTNLVKWTNRGVVFNVADLKWAKGHAWAPTIARVGNTYYFYFTADSQIGVASGNSPTGPFKDALGKALVGAYQYGVMSIDPHVFIDDDGTRYLYFGNSGLRLAKLNADMISFASAPVDITPSGITVTAEGSAMFKRNGTYYLQWSEGDTRQPTYRVAYARAQSPLGPFTRLAVILEQDTKQGILGPGGSTVLAIPARDEYYMAYHRFRIPGGDGTHRETCIDRVLFNTDGTIVPVKPTLNGLQSAVLP